MKKLLLAGTVAAMALSSMVGLQAQAQETVELDFAAVETAYGPDMWPEIIDAYNQINPDVTINLTQEKEIESAITPRMQGGDYPDVVMLAQGRPQALPETLIREQALADISDILQLTIPGEDITVEEKLLEGFTDSTATNPYNDGQTYLMPMFYSPTGLFYNQGIFEENEWDLPQNWDDMWVLGDEAAAEDIALFSYPTTGYLDTFIYSMIYSAGGPELFAEAVQYNPEVWQGEEITQIFEILGNLATYTHPTTVANANPTDFTRNQQFLLDNEVIFLPNGTWVVGEMAEAPRADGFEWAMSAVPALDEDSDQYAYTFIEHIWVPEAAENKEAAKDFIAFLYSDTAAEIFHSYGAVQPIQGIYDQLSEEEQIFYGVYESGDVLPGMGNFVATEAIPGVDLGETLYGSFSSVVSGDMTVEEWQAEVVDVMSQFHDKLAE